MPVLPIFVNRLYQSQSSVGVGVGVGWLAGGSLFAHKNAPPLAIIIAPVKPAIHHFNLGFLSGERSGNNSLTACSDSEAF